MKTHILILIALIVFVSAYMSYGQENPNNPNRDPIPGGDYPTNQDIPGRDIPGRDIPGQEVPTNDRKPRQPT